MIKAPAKALTQAMLLAYCETNQQGKKEKPTRCSSPVFFNVSFKDIDGLPHQVNICNTVAFPGLNQDQVAAETATHLLWQLKNSLKISFPEI